ncbi:unnamed protein product [Vitrella brassicaformis CCMP3155]|uniref:60S acidic ribosomal protein P1 n=2 Tax=Vitrella brassicaformis TaxID=1169539 RepID=A0A0G4EYJ3_VITBC|nr:unnamed protein product [Vitrella brassicaformis CCMP3155]|mmetsp:Transcript_20952/g.51074  ORF Transcript_20952/g.51074 Transcript_20952/m.51074 type:complete len:125 (+) Transcript_20952:45-419(+)|eukprot:CEM04123.1 unnamed protein product [Vitrella brassicaformis CCMP3155]
MAAIPVTDISDAEKQELACTYAALILHDEETDITAENIEKLVSAAGLKVEPFLPRLFEKLLQGRDLASLLSAAGTAAAGPAVGGGAAPAAGGGAAPAAEEAKEEEKKEEEEEEEDEDMGFSLFD